MTLKPQATLAAERISFTLPVFGEFYLSVDSLETFAKEGKITREFDFYAKRFNEETLTIFRQILQREFELNPTAIYKQTNSPIGERLLRQFGEAVYPHHGQNGIYAIRAAVLLAATDEEEGLTPINVLRKFPGDEIQIDAGLLRSVFKETSNFFAYNDSTVKAIAQIAETEINKLPQTDFEELADIRQPGNYKVQYKPTTFEIERSRQTTIGFSDSYELKTDIYLPKDLSGTAPMAVITHGFGSSQVDFDYLAEHLASHGYIVLVPEHIGSNTEYKEAFLRGEVSVDVSPIEFYSRPQDITYLLNEVEQDPELNKLINWEQVGILGHSFGGNTALAIAGAPINQERINQVCQENEISLNISMLLQCRASGLPLVDTNMQDPRVKAVVAANPVTSTALGVEGMGEIEIPTMMLAGSQDTTTPFITEQAHPFLWLNTEHKYLGVMAGGTHGYLLNDTKQEGLASIFPNPLPEVRRDYLKAMSLAFFEVHLRDNEEYKPYLGSAYAKYISNEELPLHLVQSLSVEQLEQAYGDTSPTEPIPEPIVASSRRQSDNVLADIRNTKTLKVAMRSDAAPFGYIDNQEQLWTGYCSDLADSLGEYLTEKLDTPGAIEVKKVPSTLENRFELVANNTVHLECGSNTVALEQKDVTFSKPFFISGTRFLVAKDKADKIDTKSDLQGIKTGVLQDTTTAEFIQSTYPDTDTVLFQGTKGRIEGIKSVANGAID
ncbi:MAG: alpha/beta hydrolase, partial [Cyanobacteria bacterium P01_G01_bin.19]